MVPDIQSYFISNLYIYIYKILCFTRHITICNETVWSKSRIIRVEFIILQYKIESYFIYSGNYSLSII